MHVQAVLQAQRQELFFVQLTGHEALDLIAKLRNPFEHQCPIVIIVLIHSYLIRIAGHRALWLVHKSDYAPAVQHVTDSPESLKTVSERARSPQQRNLSDPHK
ncbi:hypothetical protein D3C72_1904020 [compost metagenome]